MWEIWLAECSDISNNTLDVLLVMGFNEYSAVTKKLEKERKEY